MSRASSQWIVTLPNGCLNSQQFPFPSMPVAGGSSSHEPSYVAKQRLNGEIASIDAEISSINEDIDRLVALKVSLEDRKDSVRGELARLDDAKQQINRENGSISGKRRRENTIDYTEEFEWTESLRGTMNRVFNIENFRLCQEG